MKECGNCGASNFDVAKFCNECGGALGTLALIETAESATSEKTDLLRALAARLHQLQARRKADVMFVLDCTGSMQGEIDAIRDAIMSFAHSIRDDGVRARVGLVAFRDRLIDEEHHVLSFAGEVFTDDPIAFGRELSKLSASGGGDEPESSLDAMMLALRQPFDNEANKVIVLVTDAPPHVPDLETKTVEEVVDAIRAAEVSQVYLVIRTTEEHSQVYLRFLEGRRGLAFDLGTGDDFRSRAEDFRRTLMSLGKTISQATR